MKKMMTVLLLGTIILGGSVSIFAETCALDPEAYEEVVEIKDEFLDDLIEEGIIDKEEANHITENFISETGQEELMALGFSSWLKEHGYADDLLAN